MLGFWECFWGNFNVNVSFWVIFIVYFSILAVWEKAGLAERWVKVSDFMGFLLDFKDFAEMAKIV